jgi:predicted lipid carrier protein YhbT
VAGGRADADVCLYEGLLNVGGDVELGEAVLHTLRSFP